MTERDEEMEGEEVDLVAVGEIRKDFGLWPRLNLNQAKVQEYAENLEDLPPLLVARSDKDALDMVLIDGFHRLAAFEQEEETNIPCRFIQVESQADLLARATKENTGRALPLPVAEKKIAAVRLRKADWEISDIAERVQRSQRTVYRWLEDYEDDREAWVNNEIVRLHKQKGLNFAAIGRKLDLDLHRSTISRRYDKAVADLTSDKNATGGEPGQRSEGEEEEPDSTPDETPDGSEPLAEPEEAGGDGDGELGEVSEEDVAVAVEVTQKERDTLEKLCGQRWRHLNNAGTLENELNELRDLLEEI